MSILLFCTQSLLHFWIAEAVLFGWATDAGACCFAGVSFTWLFACFGAFVGASTFWACWVLLAGASTFWACWVLLAGASAFWAYWVLLAGASTFWACWVLLAGASTFWACWVLLTGASVFWAWTFFSRDLRFASALALAFKAWFNLALWSETACFSGDKVGLAALLRAS